MVASFLTQKGSYCGMPKVKGQQVWRIMFYEVIVDR